MARGAAAPEEQLELIDVDGPELKPVKKQITEYEKLTEENKVQHSADRQAERDKRKKVFAAIEAAGIKPDAEGVYRFLMGGHVWEFSQEAQLKIKKKNAPREPKSDDDDPKK